MKTTRTRMLVVFIAAAVVISLFMHWDDFAKDFHEGWNDAQHDYSRTR